MKKKYLILLASTIALLPISGVLAYGFGGFWGFNNLDPDQIVQRQQMMFEREAKILGISVDELKNYWANGKTMKEIMEEKGINQEDVQKRMKEIRLQELKSYLDILVSKGVISQDQANKRYEVMQNWTENGRMGRGKGLFWGMGVGLPCGRN